MRKYRDVMWNLEVSDLDLQEEFKAEYGLSTDALFVDSEVNKGGTRLAVVCGERAHQSIAAAWQDAAAVGPLLSSAPGRLLPAVQNLQTAEAALKQRLAALQNALSAALAQAAVPGQPAVLHCDGADGDGLRRICLAVSARTNALTAVLASGGQGLAYALCLPGGDVRPVCKALNEAFGGRGGGRIDVGIVGPNRFNDAAITRSAFIGNNDTIEGSFLSTHTFQTNFYCHNFHLLKGI